MSEVASAVSADRSNAKASSGGGASPNPPMEGRNGREGGGRGKSKKKRKGGGKQQRNKKPKLTKEERRAKYTQLARDRRDKYISRKRNMGLVCYRCRRRGHAASECAAAAEEGVQNEGVGGAAYSGGEGAGPKICFRCGSTEHGLTGCPKMRKAPRLPSGKVDYNRVELPHAKCYVCGEMGHLASRCEKNEERGIFVHGGSCRRCGSKLHLAADCPKNKKEREVKNNAEDDEAAVDDLLEDEDTRTIGRAKEKGARASTGSDTAKRKKRKVVNF